MPDNDHACECEARNYPLCRFCDDDLYCPQCGGEITRISSDCERSRTIWIYPPRATGSEAVHFEFGLTLACRGADRERIERSPVLSLDACSVDSPGIFQRDIELVGPLPDNKSLLLRLMPMPKQLTKGPSWYTTLPLAGLSARFTAVGDFGERRFDLLVCRRPEFVVTLGGRGILPGDSHLGDSWHVWRSSELELELTLEAVTAPAYLDEPFVEVTTDGTFVARLIDTLPAGTVLAPGEPRRLRLYIDTRSWELEDPKVLTLVLSLGCIGRHQEKLTLERVELGDLAWSEPGQLNVGHMHFGEVSRSSDELTVWGPLTVTNVGADTLWINRPMIRAADHEANGWIAVDWDGGDGPDRQIAPGQSETLNLVIDLRRLDAAVVAEGQPLTAFIVLTDDLLEWQLPVLVPSVTSRRPLSDPLAIDFGSTNSYAAVWNPGGPFEREGQVVAAVGRPYPETFASIMFFRDVSDPSRPDYIVGREAAELGKRWPMAMVAGLKRQIGVREPGGRLPVRHVRDEAGNLATYDVPALIRLLIKEIVRQSADALRHDVRRIGLSFPTNFGAARIRALCEIVDSLIAEYPPGQLECAGMDVDEANAVALGYLLEPETYETKILPAMKQSKSSVVIGSFDFGGGTIDTALLRVELKGAFGRMHSEYLGIGGDEHLGGDNVTVAAQEILHGRLQRILSEAAQPEGARATMPVDRPDQPTTGAARANFDALWRAAEYLKIFACTPDPSDDERRLLDTRLALELERLTGELPMSDGLHSGRLTEKLHFRQRLEEAIQQGTLLIDLDELYDHRIVCDSGGVGGYTIRERIERCVDQLIGFAANKSADINFVVLAGASCRVPLVQQRIRECIPSAEICYEPPPAKSKVAFGLARYLYSKQNRPAIVAGLSSPTDYSHAPIGLVSPHGTFVPIIPTCSRVKLDEHSAWHDFLYLEIPLGLTEVWTSGEDRIVRIYRDRYPKPELIGHFCLREAASDERLPHDASDVAADLPAHIPDDAHVAVRLAGREDDLQLKVEINGHWHGFWRLISAADGG